MIRKKTASLDLNELIKSLYLLMKPRVMSLVIFTCAVGFLTSNSDLKILDAMISIAFVALGAGAAGPGRPKQRRRSSRGAPPHAQAQPGLCASG